MKIKKFIGESMHDTLIKVKKEMGSNAVILHSRKLKKGGFLGLFSKYYIEVTAAVDNQESPSFQQEVLKPVLSVENKPKEQELIKPTFNVVSKPQESTVSDLYKELYKKPYQRIDQESNTSKKKEKGEDTIYRGKEIEVIKKDIYEVKSMVNLISEKITQSNTNNNPNQYHDPIHNQAYNILVNQGVLPEIANSFIEKAKTLKGNMGFWDCLANEMEKTIPPPSPINIKGQKPIIASFIGPTGVGKTTTIAKIAAHYSLHESKKVALITADTFRIAAVDQLQTYGEILDIPLQVIYNPGDIGKAIEKFADYDLILFDTAGRSHKNKMQISELKAYLENKNHIMEVHLVLSITTKYHDLIEIIDSFDVLKNAKIIFSKIDETSRYGSIFNIIHKTKKPLSYITIGQSVPEDIETANPKKIVRLLLGDIYNERSSQ